MELLERAELLLAKAKDDCLFFLKEIFIKAAKRLEETQGRKIKFE